MQCSKSDVTWCSNYLNSWRNTSYNFYILKETVCGTGFFSVCETSTYWKNFHIIKEQPEKGKRWEAEFIQF